MWLLLPMSKLCVEQRANPMFQSGNKMGRQGLLFVSCFSSAHLHFGRIIMSSEPESATSSGDILVEPEQEPKQLNKTDQDNDVVRMYEHIKKETRYLEDRIKAEQKKTGMMIQAIDNLDAAPLRKSIMKAEDPTLKRLAVLISETRATIFGLEGFEKSFRAEWKSKKKASLEQRQVYFDEKQNELAQHFDELSENLRTIVDDARRQSGHS